MLTVGPRVKSVSLNDPLELCATGVVTLTADGGIPNVKNLCGNILIKLIQVGLGSVNIASAGGIELVDGALLQAAETSTWMPTWMYCSTQRSR